MNILGISSYYHDSAACLVSNGKVVSAAQEERFNRRKNSSDFPVQAINYCLQAQGMTINDIDYVAFYEKPFLKFQRVVLEHLKSYPFSIRNFLETMPHWLDDRLVLPMVLKNEIGYGGKVLFVKHHLAHAASAFLASQFEEAAIITSDGIGEFASMTIGAGKGNSIEIFKELQYPNSLGLLYSAITSYLGFRANRDEGKVMALASYGKPAYTDAFREFIDVKEDGSFRIDSRYFGFNEGSRMYTARFARRFGKPREYDDEIEARHFDIAATLQAILEDILIKIANNLYEKAKTKNLCCAGGTFLNCVANSRLLKESPFTDIFIQPAAGDSGGALGAALYVHNSLLGKQRSYVMEHASLGPEFPEEKIETLLINRGAKYRKLADAELARHVAREIARGKIVAWFQGRLEWGPRALGNRSILADSRNPGMKDILNEKVKHREWFRPYGVSVLLENLKDYVDVNVTSPYMLLVGNVKESKKMSIPAAVHVDGTTRLQTVTKAENGLYYDVIQEFKKLTKVPMIINTSFNDKNEPIVCTPEEAYACFINTNIDCLVLENFFVEK